MHSLHPGQMSLPVAWAVALVGGLPTALRHRRCGEPPIAHPRHSRSMASCSSASGPSGGRSDTGSTERPPVGHMDVACPGYAAASCFYSLTLILAHSARRSSHPSTRSCGSRCSGWPERAHAGSGNGLSRQRSPGTAVERLLPGTLIKKIWRDYRANTRDTAGDSGYCDVVRSRRRAWCSCRPLPCGRIAGDRLWHRIPDRGSLRPANRRIINVTGR